jgi:hypothetical protein
VQPAKAVGDLVSLPTGHLLRFDAEDVLSDLGDSHAIGAFRVRGRESLDSHQDPVIEPRQLRPGFRCTFDRVSLRLTGRLAAAMKDHLEILEDRERAPVFRGPAGGQVRYRTFHGRVWKPTLAHLGLPHTGLHVLRLSAAARLIQAGATPKAVQTVLGHRSAAFTLTVYGHLFDADLDDLAARLDAPADCSRTGVVPIDRAARTAGR